MSAKGMSTVGNPTETPSDTATATTGRVRASDLIAVTWRQHRLMIVGTGTLVLLFVVGMLVLAAIGSAAPAAAEDPFDSTFAAARGLSTLGCVALMTFGALIAVFWAAPLLAREYEQHTNLLVWSQDVSPLRWLVGKVLPLLVVAVAFAVLLGGVTDAVLDHLNEVSGPSGLSMRRFGDPFFEPVPLVQAGYAVFGFALGLTASAVLRRTVPAMGVALVLYAALRTVIAVAVRPYFQTPVRVQTPLGAGGAYEIDRDALYLHGGYLDAGGHEVRYPRACQVSYSTADSTVDNSTECLRRNGVVSSYTDFQPIDRIGTFRLIEFGIYAVLAAALFAVVWRLLRTPRG